MGKNQLKICLHCNKQVTTSSKTCTCGYSFKMKTKRNVTKGISQVRKSDKTRKTKTKPVQSGKYEKLLSKKLSTPSPPKPHTQTASNRMQLTTNQNKAKPDVEQQKEEELEEIVLSQETLDKFADILQDINCKIYAASWRE